MGLETWSSATLSYWASPALKSHGAARICIRGELAIAVTADTGLYCRGEFIGSKRFLHCNIAADSNNIASHE